MAADNQQRNKAQGDSAEDRPIPSQAEGDDPPTSAAEPASSVSG